MICTAARGGSTCLHATVGAARAVAAAGERLLLQLQPRVQGHLCLQALATPAVRRGQCHQRVSSRPRVAVVAAAGAASLAFFASRPASRAALDKTRHGAQTSAIHKQQQGFLWHPLRRLQAGSGARGGGVSGAGAQLSRHVGGCGTQASGAACKEPEVLRTLHAAGAQRRAAPQCVHTGTVSCSALRPVLARLSFCACPLWCSAPDFGFGLRTAADLVGLPAPHVAQLQ